MKNKNLVLFIALLSLITLGYAATPDYNEFLESTADAILKFFSEMTRRIVFLGMIWEKVNSIKYAVYDNLPYFLLTDPQVDAKEITGISGYFVRILQPLYVMAIVLTGIYLIFFSTSPAGRSKAKAMLFKLLLGMVVISLSMPIMQLLFQVSNALTGNILAQGPLDIGFTYKRGVDYMNYRTSDFMWGNIAVGIPLFIISFILATGVFIVLSARYFLLIFLIVFFPVAVFLTFFEATKNMGKILLKHLIFWIFLPVGYALVLVTITVGSQNLAGLPPEISNMVSVSGTFLLVLSPLIMFALMDWLSIYAEPTIEYLKSVSPFSSLTESGEKRRKKAKAEGQTPALGIRGYETVDEKKEKLKRKKSAALGLKGYETVEEGGEGVQEEGGESKSKYVTGIRKPGIIPRSSGAYGLITGEESVEQEGDIPAHAGSRINPEERKNAKAFVVIPPKGMQNVMLELGEGDSETITVIVKNEGDEMLHNIRVYDEDLDEAGLEVSYSSNFFTLKKGEERLIKIKINAGEKAKKGSHGGTICFISEKGVRSLLDVEVKTSGKKTKDGESPEAKGREKDNELTGSEEEAGAQGSEYAYSEEGGAGSGPPAMNRRIKGKEKYDSKKKFKEVMAKEWETDSTLGSFFGTTREPVNKTEQIKKQKEGTPRGTSSYGYFRASREEMPVDNRPDSTLTSMFGTTREPVNKTEQGKKEKEGTPRTDNRQDSTITSLFGTTKEPMAKAEPEKPQTKKEEPPKEIPLPPKTEVEKRESPPEPPAPQPAPEQPTPAPQPTPPEPPKAETRQPEREEPKPRPKYVEEETPTPAPEAVKEEPKTRRPQAILKDRAQEPEEKKMTNLQEDLQVIKPITSVTRPAKPARMLRRKKKDN